MRTYYLFMDESGDIGFKFDRGSSNHFVVCMVGTEDERELGKCLKRARSKMPIRSRISEIKSSGSRRDIKRRVLMEFMKTRSEIHYISVDKRNLSHKFGGERRNLYNYIAGIIMAESSFSSGMVNLVVDKRESKIALRDDFDRHIKNVFQNSGISIIIEHKNSDSSPQLQVADYVANAVFRKYEHGDEEMYNLIRDKVRISKKI